jgi:hypothetical protein
MAGARRFGGAVRFVVFSAALVFILGACGGGSGNVSASSLEPRLLPASSVPGFSLLTKLDWSDPVDLVAQGVPLPEPTYPSAGVEEFQDANVKGAAGEVLRRGAGADATEIRIGVAKFGSDSDAGKVRDWMHAQDLQQPCFGACTFRSQAVQLSGVPDSAAVIQTQVAARPPKPANYRAEFTVGNYLYWAWFSADSSAKTRSLFDAGIGRYYAHAKQQTS